MGKLLLENHFKPADIHCSNFVCTAFWIERFILKPFKPKTDPSSAAPAMHSQWHGLVMSPVVSQGSLGGLFQMDRCCVGPPLTDAIP